MNYDIAIIGGGLVGLATGLKIKQFDPNLSIALLEKESGPAKHQSGNNSGVIHSGLYYKPGSLKATNCIRGYQQLIEFCREENIPFEITGKVVVATAKNQIPLLDSLLERGLCNGLEGSRKISLVELKELEPHCTGLAAIYVPQTGIVDFKMVALAYEKKLAGLGADLFFEAEVLGITNRGGTNVISTSGPEIKAKLIINCAGLFADKVAAMTAEEALEVKIIPFRGEYYNLKKESEHLVKNLIYPVPDPNFPFLGVHFTRRMAGGIEAGPNAVLAFRREGYRWRDINAGEFLESLRWPGFQKVAARYWKTGLGEYYRSLSKKAFTNALRQLIPELRDSDLEKGGAGVRAQACDRNGGLLEDFYIKENPRAINVLNAPSPAATSSLSIGETVAKLALARF